MKNKNILMCSGGPDSMALLHKSYKLGYELVVVHVNYQKRDTAIRDEKIVSTFCNEHNIELEILKPHYQKEFGNFQGWARDVRYNFAIEVAKKYQVTNILVAHHLDDAIETYLIQKQRGATPENYGLVAEVAYQNCNLIRPCLSESKEELLQYCVDNSIPFGIDESNLGNDYLRNRLRHEIVSDLSSAEKHAIYEEITKLNESRRLEEAKYYQLINENAIFDIDDILKLDNLKMFLRLWIRKDLSDDYLTDIIKQISDSPKVKIEFASKYLIKEYSKLYLMDSDLSYAYTFTELEYFQTSIFKISENGNRFSKVSVSKDDYPLTIRNYQKGDKIEMKYGSKKLSRWFKDNKILTINRHRWPVVVNRVGEIILVPEIGCNLRHFTNKESFFVVQYLINWN